MTVYSHSRLSCFEQCPLRYKYAYIDKVETEVAESIEAFLGSRVHETLEHLYENLRYQELISLEELLEYFHQKWNENWTDEIIIVKKRYGPENYKKMGEKFITDYYKRYRPFDIGKTIALEERILINLDEEGNYKLQGYIDRLTESEDGYYEIHDYKTNSRLPLADYIRNDRQLALYMIGVKSNYPDVERVRLIWHFLAFDKEIDSTRTDEELDELKRETIKLIDRIESENKFEACPSYLCEWCEFKPVCKQWSHLYVLREKPDNEYLNNSGVKLVDRYAELKEKHKQVTLDLYAELEKLEKALIAFSEKEGVDVVFGSKNKVRIKELEQSKFPSKHSKERQRLEQVLKEHGKWEEVLQLDTAALNKIIQEKQWNSTLLDVLSEYVKLERSKRLYLSKIKEN